MSVVEKGLEYVMGTYNRMPVLFTHGEGCYMIDEEGNKYLDFVSGIAVNSLGHNHPAVTKAIQEQCEKMIHCSNLYWTEPQVKLAELLVEKSGLGKVFYCNSGTEANEAAIKLARKVGQGKYHIISMKKSFHGRTMGSLAATGQEKYQKAFQPILPGFSWVDYGDLDQLKAEIVPETCAVLLEVVQGEGGVNVPSIEYLQGVQALCKEHNILLIVDEVQTGMGRTGKAFGYQNFGIEPDIITLAKALGNGVPIGAMIAKKEIAEQFVPGDHASTFGGNPLATSAAVATSEIILDDVFLAEVTAKGEYFRGEVAKLQEKHPGKIMDIRGLGLMIGVELSDSVAPMLKGLEVEKILVNGIGDHILRFVPPLVMEKEQIDKVIKVLDSLLA